MKRTLVFIIVAMCAVAAVYAQSADEVISRLDGTVDNLESISFDFINTFTSETTGGERVMDGSLVMKPPHLVKLETDTQTIVVDGESVWWYIPQNNQVQRSTFIEDESMFPTPYSIFRRYTARGNAEYKGTETVNGRECSVLYFAPAGESVSDVTVWIDNGLGFPIKSREQLPTSDVNVYELSDVKLNEPVDDAVFKFEPPEGVDVIDMRE